MKPSLLQYQRTTWHNGQSLAILVHASVCGSPMYVTFAPVRQAVALAEGRSASAALAGATAAARELPPSGNTGGTSSGALSHV
jgi:hypothetical protein